MKKLYLPLGLALALLSCSPSFEAKENLDDESYKNVLMKVAPYVIKKPDEFGYEDRFKSENQSFYSKYISLTNGKLLYYFEKDTATLFYFEHKDLSSLYEHYRGLGGYFKTNSAGDIVFMNILYHTPRLTRSEMNERAPILFTEMFKVGNVVQFKANKNYIDTPNDDFFYNTKTNRWDYTENSSWKFLKEAKQSSDSTLIN